MDKLLILGIIVVASLSFADANRNGDTDFATGKWKQTSEALGGNLYRFGGPPLEEPPPKVQPDNYEEILLARNFQSVTNDLSNVKRPATSWLSDTRKEFTGTLRYYATVEFAREQIENYSIPNLGTENICITNDLDAKLAWTEKKLSQFSDSLEKAVGQKASDDVLNMISFRAIALSDGPHDPIGSIGHSLTEKQAKEMVAFFGKLDRDCGKGTSKKILDNIGGLGNIATGRMSFRSSTTVTIPPNRRFDFYKYQMVATVTVYEAFTPKSTGKEITTVLFQESKIPLINAVNRVVWFETTD